MRVKHKLTLPDTLTLMLHADRNTGQQPARNLSHYDRVPVGNQPVVMGVEWTWNTSLTQTQHARQALRVSCFPRGLKPPVDYFIPPCYTEFNWGYPCVPDCSIHVCLIVL